jgi:hypothetical protein
MMEHAKNISLFLIIGLIITFLANWLQSDFISKFLSANLITLLIALIAINATTLSVVLTKIRELADRHGGDFSRTATEMKTSILEQVVLVIFAGVIEIIGSSSLISSKLPVITFISNVFLTGIFSYAIYILYDTANSVFVILNFENNMAKNEDKKEKKNTKPG